MLLQSEESTKLMSESRETDVREIDAVALAGMDGPLSSPCKFQTDFHDTF